MNTRKNEKIASKETLWRRNSLTL